mgnify:CR=1 FL=1
MRVERKRKHLQEAAIQPEMLADEDRSLYFCALGLSTVSRLLRRPSSSPGSSWLASDNWFEIWSCDTWSCDTRSVSIRKDLRLRVLALSPLDLVFIFLIVPFPVLTSTTRVDGWVSAAMLSAVGSVCPGKHTYTHHMYTSRTLVSVWH